MNKRFLRLGKTLGAGRSLIWGNPLAAGVVFAIVISLLVLLSLLLRDVDQVALPTPDGRTTSVSALQSEPPANTPTATPSPGANAIAANEDVATVPPTVTATGSPSPTPTATDASTPSPTVTSTVTPTPTATELYVPISVFPSEIEIGASDNVTGRVVLFPARLRAGPTTQDDVLARLGQDVQVTLGGIVASGTWVLLKVTDSRTESEGEEGWMAVELLERGEIKTYHIRLSDILREYVEGRFGVDAMEMTTGEVLDGLQRTDADRRAVGDVRRVLDRCDLVKFAKLRPAIPECRELFPLARRVVDVTTPVEPAPAGPAAVPAEQTA